MRKYHVLSAAVLLLGLFSLSGCQENQRVAEQPSIATDVPPVKASPTPFATLTPTPSTSDAPAPAALSTTPMLTVEEVVVARNSTDNKLEPVPDHTFKRGAKVHMVLVNVRGFAKGTDGKNFFDIDIQVKDPTGRVILSQPNLLGPEGHRDLPGNIARTPYGVFETSPKLQPGKYMMTLTLHDKIGKGFYTASETVILQ
jgi:hypothetical protein